MSNVNNVDRLMQELDVEQLIQFQSSLKKEMEKKREELRQMVGRRYRDVLEASNTVKRLCEIADELAALLADIRQNANEWKRDKNAGELPFSTNLAGTNVVPTLDRNHNAGRRFLLLQSLLSMCFTSNGLLTRAFALCLANNFHRTLSSESHSLSSFEAIVINMFSNQLIQIRMELQDVLTDKMGVNASWNAIVSTLVSYALLRPRTTVEELLQLFLKSRMDFMMTNLQQPDSTLLGLIRAMKDTVQCAEQIFGDGGALLSALQCVATKGWSPASVEQLVENQPLLTRQLLKAEIELVNSLYPFFQLPDQTEVQKQCSDWVVKMCEIVGERVRKMCSYFEQVDQAVEFAVAVGQLFKSNWSSVFASNSLIYRQLFGNALFDRFNELIAMELQQLEQQIRSKMPHTNCEPFPLFHKRSAKFDALLASGISHELNELIQQLSDSLRLLHQNINKYTLISQEENVEQLHEVLADQVLAFVDRLTNFSSWNIPDETTFQLSNALTSLSLASTSADGSSRSQWLALFRLLLALVQHEPSVLCQCMNRNVDKIVRCNRTLHKATEQALCRFMDFVIDDCVRVSNILVVMRKCCSSWDGWMELLQEPERVQLSETAILAVPTQLSQHFFLFLSTIYRAINQNSLGHLLTRTVTLHVSQRIGHLLSQLLCQCAEHSAPVPQICFIDASQRIEAKLDPIELSVLQEPISRNAKLFAQRTAMLFGQLQAEPITTLKDAELPSAYSQLIDITPRGADVQRLTQIPRLSKLKEESQKSVEEVAASIKQSKKQRKTKTGTAEVGGLGLPVKGAATSSFSSLYDKISTGWFKS
uniref:Conserved oligomeric Golgi complex subunit 1 n=1 Tax=Globodera rostochiensis TaxID=31243 RepID=A0A914GRA2_GLORO